MIEILGLKSVPQLEREGKESIALSRLDCYSLVKSRHSRWFGIEGRTAGLFKEGNEFSAFIIYFVLYLPSYAQITTQKSYTYSAEDFLPGVVKNQS